MHVAIPRVRLHLGGLVGVVVPLQLPVSEATLGDETPPLSSNGHRGWTPAGGERVRVYLASRAHDGFHTADENGDGGFNVLHPNGFERLEPSSLGADGAPGEGGGPRPPR